MTTSNRYKLIQTLKQSNYYSDDWYKSKTDNQILALWYKYTNANKK